LATAWSRLAVDPPPVAHVFAVNNRDAFRAPVFVVDHILTNQRSILDVPLVSLLIRTTAHARGMQKVKLRQLVTDFDPFDLVGKVLEHLAPQLDQARPDLKGDAFEGLLTHRHLRQTVALRSAT